MITGQIMYNKNNAVNNGSDNKCNGCSGNMSAKEKANAYIKQCLEDYSAGISGYTEEEKNEYVANIYRKYRSGKKLSAREMNYLRQNDPETYMHAMRVRLKRNILEDQLKHCKSKRQAKQIYADTIVSIDDRDPDKEVLIEAYKDAWKEFKKSGKYNRLQDTAEEEYTVTVKEKVYISSVYSVNAECDDVYNQEAVYEAEA